MIGHKKSIEPAGAVILLTQSVISVYNYRVKCVSTNHAKAAYTHSKADKCQWVFCAYKHEPSWWKIETAPVSMDMYVSIQVGKLPMKFRKIIESMTKLSPPESSVHYVRKTTYAPIPIG